MARSPRCSSEASEEAASADRAAALRASVGTAAEGRRAAVRDRPVVATALVAPGRRAASAPRLP